MAIKNSQFVFSTTWNGHRVVSGHQMIDEIMAMGFDEFELNYKVTEEMLRDIMPAIEQGKIKIRSVHNVFPKYPDKTYDTDSLLLGYPDKERRTKAIELTKRSIDYGHTLGAKAVVIHPGGIPIAPHEMIEKQLKELYKTGKRHTEDYERLLQELIALRRKHVPQYLTYIQQSLEILSDHIQQKGYDIVLGIENRAVITDIPDFEEGYKLCTAIDDQPVYFWYDIGHGMILRELGYHDDLQVIQQVKHKIIGTHIHETKGIQDHWAPYAVSTDLDKYLDIIKDIPIKVLELNARNTEEQVMQGAAILSEKLIAKNEEAK